MSLTARGIFGFCLILMLQRQVQGQNLSVETVPQIHSPYCGIFAAASALRALGKTVDIRQLIQSRKYLSDPRGSTPDDLARLAQSYEFDAVVLENTQYTDLVRSEFPAILWTRSDISKSVPDHYVLAIRSKDHKLLIYDGPREPVEVSNGEFAGYWTGTAIFVVPKGTHAWQVVGASVLTRCSQAIVLCLGGFLVLWFLTEKVASRSPSIRQRITRSVSVQVALILAASAGLGFTCSYTLADGISRRSDATSAIVMRYRSLACQVSRLAKRRRH